MKFSVQLAVIGLAVVSGCGRGGPDGLKLVDNGVKNFKIEVAENASGPEKFAAQELNRCLSLKVARAEDGSKSVSSGPRIRVTVKVDPDLLPAGVTELERDAFEIAADEQSLTVTGASPRGALFGAYEILKEYAGMRWLVPGDDGEYCVLEGSTVVVPFGKKLHRPYLKIRETRTGAEEGWLWSARNNMQCEVGCGKFRTGKDGRKTKDTLRLEELAVGGIGPCGHIQSTLLLGGGDEAYRRLSAKEKLERRFEEHPEWFPMDANGKRVKISGAGDRNPCVSNRKYLDHAAKVICEWIACDHGRDGYMTLGNNDTTLWCECAKCRALDAPEMKGTKGEISDRYWYMVNEIAKRVWKKYPDAKFAGWAYQNYWYPPVKTKIDPRLKVFVSFNNQCWRHSCLDPKCTINAEMKKIYTMWKATGLPLVVNRDEISCSGNPGSDFLPSESVIRQNLHDYREMNCSGSHFCVMGPYPRRPGWMKNNQFEGYDDEWYAMWQSCYTLARLGWDLSRNWTNELEEANSLYYGKAAWNGAMREFRRNLEQAFFGTPGCIGWGSGAPLGRCLDQAGTEAKLKGLLEKAVKLAKDSGDARALAHCEMEARIFRLTWLKARQVYLDNFRELNAYRRTGEIRVDGVLDEADWKNADVLSNFKAPEWGKVRTEDLQQTFVRVTYDRDHLYLAVEAMESEIAKMKAGKSVDRTNGYGQLGNHVELFYSFPDMAERCFQLMVNSEGQMFDVRVNSVSDKDSSFRTQAEWAVKKGTDRWTVEIAIPCAEIGQNCFDGATWRLNVARQREVEGAKRESSSACNGGFYAPATFINLKFTPERPKGINQARDTAPWQNAAFDSTRPNPTDRRFTWTKWGTPDVPAAWDGRGCTGRMVEENGNRYVHLVGGRGCDFSQYFVGPGKGRIRTVFRARGKGKINIWTGNYSDKGGRHIVNGPDGRSTSRNNVFELTPEWKSYSFETPKLGIEEERVAHRIRMTDGSEADVDDVFLTPMFE